MKNLQIILFTLAMMVMSFNSSSQIIVDQQGQVGLGPWYNSHSNVTGSAKVAIDGKLVISLYPAHSGIIFSNYNNQPIIYDNFWNMSGYIGNPYKWWQSLNVYKINGFVYTNGSDRKIKNNIQPLRSVLDDLLKVNVISFDYNEKYFKGADPDDLKMLLKDGENQFGVIAQELKPIFPSLVGYTEETELYSVNYSKFIPIVIKAMQEQQAIIEELKGEIKMLKDRK